MGKKIISGLFLALMLLAMGGCGSSSQSISSSQKSSSLSSNGEKLADSSDLPQESGEERESSQSEMRAVWFSYLDLRPMLLEKTEKEARLNLEKAFQTVSNYGMTDVFVQVRPYGDALYRSELFPSSHLLTGKQGDSLPYDPLAIMVEIAHQKNLRIHAWINPFRVQEGKQPPALSADNPAQKWLQDGSDNVVSLEKGLFYNPAKEEVLDLVVKGAEEIAANYEVDGIHMDDYFYPTAEETFDAEAFAAYQKENGYISLAKWRRGNVNHFMKRIYQGIKSKNKNVVFGVSPQGDVTANYEKEFADVGTWTSEEGYLDYIMPQLYYGFDNEKMPFLSVANQWNDLVKLPQIKLYFGFSAYKIGKEDQWAGKGKEEWQTASDILFRQVQAVRLLKRYSGFGIYRYASLFEPEADVKAAVEKEKAELHSLLTSSSKA